MGVKARIPAALTSGPFRREDARRAGLKRWHLESDAWKRIGPNTFAAAPLVESAEVKIAAANHRLPTDGAFSGFTAVYLHRLDNTFREPMEITVPSASNVSTRAGMVVRRRALDSSEVVTVQGLRVTSVCRTLHDVAAALTPTETVVLVDHALHHSQVNRDSLSSSNRLSRVVDYVEPLSESPMETRLRMCVVLAGLPRPQAQALIRNRFYRVIARIDLYYPEHKLGLEYDGETHKDNLAADNRRQNLLTGMGIRLLRFTAGDIYNRPDLVASQVRAALSETR